VTEKELPEIKRLLAKYKLKTLDYSGSKPQSSACVSFAACGMFRRARRAPSVLTLAPDHRIIIQHLQALIGKAEKILAVYATTLS